MHEMKENKINTYIFKAEHLEHTAQEVEQKEQWLQWQRHAYRPQAHSGSSLGSGRPW